MQPLCKISATASPGGVCAAILAAVEGSKMLAPHKDRSRADGTVEIDGEIEREPDSAGTGTSRVLIARVTIASAAAAGQEIKCGR